MHYHKLPIIILSEMVSNSSDSTKGFIAAYFLEHMKEIPSLSIRELAEKANVSAASISRFCRDIGLEDYNELKELATSTVNEFEIFPSADTADEWKDNYITAVQKGLERVKRSIDIKKIDALCADIYNYKKVAVFGVLKAEGVALNLMTDLILQEKLVTSKFQFSEQIEYLQHVDEDDLVIIFSFRGIYFSYGLPKCFDNPRGKRPKIWFITGDSSATDSGLYDEVISFDSSKRQTSHPYQLQLVASMIAQRYAMFKRAKITTDKDK